MVIGARRKSSPHKILKNPWKEVPMLICWFFFLLENNKLNMPLNRIIPPTVITTDLSVRLGTTRKSIPTARVRIPLMNTFWGEGRNKSFMVVVLLSPEINFKNNISNYLGSNG
jgi:hypothetical protein